MNAVIEILENSGLVGLEQIHTFCDSASDDVVGELTFLLQQALQQEANSIQYDSSALPARTFLASAATRGSRCCTWWECRVKSIPFLTRYSALYSDELLLPLNVGGYSDPFDDAMALKASLHMIHELRPLIDNGQVKLIPENLHMCDEHLRQEIPTFALAQEALEVFKHYVLTDGLTVYYDPCEESISGCGSFIVEASDKYFDSGQSIIDAGEAFDLLPLRVQNAKRKVLLNSRAALKSGVLNSVFRPSLDDFVLQQYYAATRNAHYLSTLEAETVFLDKVTNDPESPAAKIGKMCTALTHEIPIFSDLSLASVIEMRNAEGEAFEMYRDAVSAIFTKYIPEVSSLNASHYRQIYEEEIRPKLHELQRLAKTHRSSAWRSGCSSLLEGGAIMSMGFVGNSLPHTIPQLLEAIGGAHLVSKFISLISDLRNEPEKIQNSQFYFLYRLGKSRGY